MFICRAVDRDKAENEKTEFVPLERPETIIAVIHISSKTGVVFLIPTQGELVVRSTGTLFPYRSGAHHEIALQNSHENVNFKVCTVLWEEQVGNDDTRAALIKH